LDLKSLIYEYTNYCIEFREIRVKYPLKNFSKYVYPLSLLVRAVGIQQHYKLKKEIQSPVIKNTAHDIMFETSFLRLCEV